MFLLHTFSTCWISGMCDRAPLAWTLSWCSPILFHGFIVFSNVNILELIQPTPYWWTLSLFLVLILNNVVALHILDPTCEQYIQVYFWSCGIRHCSVKFKGIHLSCRALCSLPKPPTPHCTASAGQVTRTRKSWKYEAFSLLFPGPHIKLLFSFLEMFFPGLPLLFLDGIHFLMDGMRFPGFLFLAAF